MKYRKLFYLLFAAALIGCTQSTSVETITPVEDKTPPKKTGDKFIITDQKGNRWDVTHAVNAYGMTASKFQFGLGPNAIPPINFPNYWLPGETGFPPASRDFLVIGTDISNDARAYPIFVMKSHEIVNEFISDSAVAVAY